MRICVRLAAACVLALATYPALLLADFPGGIQWLASTSQADGSLAQPSDISTTFQSTAEAMRTFGAAGSFPATASAASLFLAADPYQNTENLSRQIINDVATGQDPSASVILLLTHQDSVSGGFGELPGYQPTVLDTAFALEALAQSGNIGSQGAAAGVGFLQQRQAADGSWSETDGDNAPSIYLTALCEASLAQYAGAFSLSPTLQGGSSYLLAARKGDGLWGQDFLSAESLIALLQSVSDITSIQSSMTALAAHQGADGSWGDDTFTTALALRVLNLAQARGNAPNGSGVVQGYVTQAGSSQPIGGATVTVSSIQGLAVQSNAAGYFMLSGLPPGNLTLTANKPGYSSASVVAGIVAGQTVTAPNLVLSPGAASGTLRVHLVDAASGAVLAGATVTINGSAGAMSAITDNSGNAEFDAVAPGHLSVSIHAGGYSDVQASVVLSGGQVLTLTQPLQSSTSLGGSGPSTFTGLVIDATSNTPISGAVFAVSNGPSATTGANGVFSEGGLNGGTYTATVSAAGYATQTLSIQAASGTTASLGTIGLYPTNNSAAPNSVTLVGTVIDGLSNKPVSGAAISVVGSALAAVSDGTGHFTVAGIPNLSFQLQLSASGYAGNSYLVSASAYGSVSGTFVLSPSGNGGSSTNLQGQITDASSGAPIAAALVQMIGTSTFVQTDASGNFQLQNLPVPQFQLQVSALNYSTQSLSVQLGGPGTYTLNVKLASSANAASGAFQVLTLAAANSGLGANQTQLFNAQVGNQSASSQEGILVGRILDATGKQVATTSPYIPGTTTTQSDFRFAAQEVKTLQLPWNPAQLPPGTYSMELDVVQPGSFSRENPNGTVLAANTAFTSVAASRTFIGTLAFNPPAAQAGSSSPVTLEVLLVNSGNVTLNATPLTLDILAGDGSVAETASTTLAQPLPPGQFAYVPFGTWLPTVSGNLSVNVSSGDSGTQGQIAGTYYVGDKSQGTFSINPVQVYTGTQTVHASINVTGVDKAVGASSPLVFAIDNAVQLGSQYVATNVKLDQNAAHCLRCHVQSQSYYGLASLLGQNVGSDQAATQFIYNGIASSEQADLSLRSTYYQYAETQTAIELWALSQVPDKVNSFGTRYTAANYLISRANTSGNQTYWSPDYGAGWWDTVDGNNMLATTGLVDVLLTARNNDTTAVQDFSLGTPRNLGGLFIGMKAGPDGNLYALDAAGAGAIVQYNPVTGQSKVVANLDGSCGQLLVISPTEFYATCHSNVVHVTPGGIAVVASTGAFGGDLARGPDGTIYVADTDNNTILAGPPSGPLVPYVSGGLLNRPMGLAFGADGGLYVGNAGGYNVLMVAPDASVSVFADGLIYPPSWITMQPDGTMWVCYPSNTDATTGQRAYPGLMLLSSRGVVQRALQVPTSQTWNDIALLNGNLFVSTQDGNVTPLAVSVMDTSRLSALASTITGVVNYTLAEYNGNPNVFQLITLGEARKVITDPALLTQINSAMAQLDAQIRSQQHADGGWSWMNTLQPSDALATALNGLALEYSAPLPSDPVLLNAVTFLLDTQATDGSWSSADGVMQTPFAATGLVMAFLPRILDQIGGLNVELHLDLPSGITLSNPGVPQSGDLDNADGSAAWTWDFKGVTSQGRVLTFDLTAANLQPGEMRPAASAAYLLSTNSFDGSQVRVDLSIPTINASDEMSLLSVGTDSASYGANGVAQVSALVQNGAPASQSGTVVFTIRASDGSVVTVLPAAPFNLEPGAAATVAGSWAVGTTLSGGYTVVADLYDSGGSKIGEKSTSVSVVTGGGSGGSSGGGSVSGPNTEVTLRVTTDKQTYNTTDQVNIADLVQNISVNGVVASATLQLAVTAPNGTTVFSASVPLGQLTPGYLRQLTNLYGLTASPSGAYQITGTVIDSTGAVLANGSASFSVVENQSITIVGTEAAQAGSIDQDQLQTCSETVTNRGTQAVTALPVKQLVINLDTGAIDLQSSATVSLAPGSTQALAPRGFSTSPLAYGHHACVLQVQINGAYRTLANAPFTVNQPAVRVSGTETATSSALTQGDAQTCIDVINNTGAQSQPSLPVRQLVINTDTGAVDQQTDLTANIASGGSQSYVRSVSTVNLAAGNHACVIQASLSGAYQTLASARFTVAAAPPASTPPTMTLSQTGRPKVLVLLDTPVPANSGGGTGCIANHRIELHGIWKAGNNPPNSSVTVYVNDDQGRTLDTETVALPGFSGPFDGSPGSGGVDLQITGFSVSDIQIALVPTTGAGFQAPRYQFVATAYSSTGGYLQQLNTGVVFPDCTTQVTNGNHYQDFTVVPGNPATGADNSDPNGPAGSPDLPTQQAFLASLLSANGWNATIDSDPNLFAADFESGEYGIVALFNERTTLSTEMQKELREAVNGGMGLIGAGGGEGNQLPTLAPALGLNYAGVVSSAGGISVPASSIYPGGASTSLLYADQVFNVNLGSATTLASYTGLTQTVPALTLNTYGGGKAMFAGYDPLLEATKAGISSVDARILLGMFNAVTPVAANPQAGYTVPFTVQLSNPGNALSGQIQFAPPSGVTLVDPGNGNFDSQGNLVFPFNLPSGGSTGDSFWLRLPTGSVTLGTQAFAASGSTTAPVASASLSLNAAPVQGLSGVLNWLAANAGSDSNYQSLQQQLGAAQQNLNQNYITTALPQMTSGADLLLSLNPGPYPAAVQLRLWLDQGLYQAEQRAITSATPPPPPATPTNLGASAASSSQINLAWTASTTASVSYNVYQSTVQGFTPSASTLVASGVGATSYSASGLSAGTTYYYEVVAISSAGSSGASNAASATTPAAGGGIACHVQYTVNSDWGSGFGVGITINNIGSSAINGWTLTWTWAGNQQFNGSPWNSVGSQSGRNVTLTNASWNPTIPAGGNVSGIGFNGSYSGSNVAPAQFFLNGSACR